jgi:hypothetical protein
VSLRTAVDRVDETKGWCAAALVTQRVTQAMIDAVAE